MKLQEVKIMTPIKERTLSQFNHGERKSYGAGNSQLLQDYRTALIEAYKLGNAIKALYGVVPPKALYDDSEESYTVSIGLTLS
jgi:hypothetical protein